MNSYRVVPEELFGIKDGKIVSTGKAFLVVGPDGIVKFCSGPGAESLAYGIRDVLNKIEVTSREDAERAIREHEADIVQRASYRMAEQMAETSSLPIPTWPRPRIR